MRFRISIAVVLGVSIAIIIAGFTAVILVLTISQRNSYKQSIYAQIEVRQRQANSSILAPLLERQASLEHLAQKTREFPTARGYRLTDESTTRSVMPWIEDCSLIASQKDTIVMRTFYISESLFIDPKYNLPYLNIVVCGFEGLGGVYIKGNFNTSWVNRVPIPEHLINVFYYEGHDVRTDAGYVNFELPNRTYWVGSALSGLFSEELFVCASYAIPVEWNDPLDPQRTTGAVYMSVFLSHVEQVLLDARMTNSSKTVLFDYQWGKYMASSDTSRPLIDASTRTTFTLDSMPFEDYKQLYRDALQLCPPSTCVSASEERGKHILSVLAMRTAAIHLILVQQTPKELFFGDWDRSLVIGISVGCAAGLLVIVSCIGIWFVILRSISTLQDAMELASDMRNDEAQTLSAHAPSFLSEIGLIQKAFEAMNHRLLLARPFMPQALLVKKLEDNYYSHSGGGGAKDHLSRISRGGSRDGFSSKGGDDGDVGDDNGGPHSDASSLEEGNDEEEEEILSSIDLDYEDTPAAFVGAQRLGQLHTRQREEYLHQERRLTNSASLSLIYADPAGGVRIQRKREAAQLAAAAAALSSTDPTAYSASQSLRENGLSHPPPSSSPIDNSSIIVNSTTAVDSSVPTSRPQQQNEDEDENNNIINFVSMRKRDSTYTTVKNKAGVSSDGPPDEANGMVAHTGRGGVVGEGAKLSVPCPPEAHRKTGDPILNDEDEKTTSINAFNGSINTLAAGDENEAGRLDHDRKMTLKGDAKNNNNNNNNTINILNDECRVEIEMEVWADDHRKLKVSGAPSSSPSSSSSYPPYPFSEKVTADAMFVPAGYVTDSAATSIIGGPTTSSFNISPTAAGGVTTASSGRRPPLYRVSVPSDTGLIQKNVAVIAINIRNFHELSRRAGADALRRIHKVLADIVEAKANSERGIVDALHGDRFIVTFNVARAVAKPAQAAAIVALRIVEESEERNALGTRHPLSIGISYGRAFVGNMGTDTIKKLSTIGAVFPEAVALERLSRRIGTPVVLNDKAKREADSVAYCFFLGQALFPRRSEHDNLALVQQQIPMPQPIDSNTTNNNPRAEKQAAKRIAKALSKAVIPPHTIPTRTRPTAPRLEAGKARDVYAAMGLKGSDVIVGRGVSISATDSWLRRAALFPFTGRIHASPTVLSSTARDEGVTRILSRTTQIIGEEEGGASRDFTARFLESTVLEVDEALMIERELAREATIDDIDINPFELLERRIRLAVHSDPSSSQTPATSPSGGAAVRQAKIATPTRQSETVSSAEESKKRDQNMSRGIFANSSDDSRETKSTLVYAVTADSGNKGTPVPDSAAFMPPPSSFDYSSSSSPEEEKTEESMATRRIGTVALPPALLVARPTQIVTTRVAGESEGESAPLSLAQHPFCVDDPSFSNNENETKAEDRSLTSEKIIEVKGNSRYDDQVDTVNMEVPSPPLTLPGVLPSTSPADLVAAESEVGASQNAHDKSSETTTTENTSSKSNAVISNKNARPGLTNINNNSSTSSHPRLGNDTSTRKSNTNTNNNSNHLAPSPSRLRHLQPASSHPEALRLMGIDAYEQDPTNRKLRMGGTRSFLWAERRTQDILALCEMPLYDLTTK